MQMLHRARTACNVVAAAALAALALSALAQSYPNRPVRLIVPLAPGGTTDITARALAPALSAALGQPVVVENRGGAGGVVGSEVVAKAAPDGYTLLLTSSDSYNVNAAMYPKLPFDARKDLTPVSTIAASPTVLAVHPALPVKSLKDLVALSKQRPKDLSYGVGGTSGLLRMEMLKRNTGMMMTNIPYKGSGPATIDLLAGHIQAGFFNLVATAPFIESGRLRGLLVTGTKRSERLPNLPTAREIGIKGFDDNVNYMIMVPAATPAEIVGRLNKELVTVLNLPDIRSRFAAEGSHVIGNSHQEAVAIQNRQIEEFAELIRKTGVKLN